MKTIKLRVSSDSNLDALEQRVRAELQKIGLSAGEIDQLCKQTHEAVESLQRHMISVSGTPAVIGIERTIRHPQLNVKITAGNRAVSFVERIRHALGL